MYFNHVGKVNQHFLSASVLVCNQAGIEKGVDKSKSSKSKMCTYSVMKEEQQQPVWWELEHKLSACSL